MSVKIALTAILIQRGEHGAVPHVVAVDNGIAVRKILLIFIVCKQAARLIIGTVIQMAQVILVIICLCHRVVNGRIRKIEPADDVLPIFPKSFKIHRG